MNAFAAFPAQPVPLQIAGESLEITPLRIGEIPSVLSAIRPFSEQLMAENTDWLAIITDQGDQLLAAIAIAARKPREWIDTLPPDEAIRLAAALLEVNADFFVQRIVPTLQHAAGQISRLVTPLNLAGMTPSSG